MPLVAPSKIGVDFDADTKKLLAESDKVVKEIDEIKKHVKSMADENIRHQKAMEDATQKHTMSWTDFRSMYQTVLDVVRVGQAIWEETGQKYIDNAVAVGNLARSLGTTTEEASRLKEVADDTGVTIDSLKTSMKLALKDGFEPNIEGLARMSDEYLKLAPGTERMQYLLDRFGKSGEEMGKLLEKGGDGIRNMAAAMDEGLIVTQKSYEEARKFQIAQDTLNDSWDAFTYKVAPPLVNAATNVLNHFTALAEAEATLAEEGIKPNTRAYMERRNELLNQIKAQQELTAAELLAVETSQNATGAFETEAEMTKRLAEEAKAAEQAIRDISKAQQEYLDLIGNLSDSNEKYIEDQQKIQDELNEGKITLQEAQERWRALADEQEQASRRMILNMLEQQLTVDGLSEAETNYLLNTGLKWGVYSQTAVDEAKAAQAEVRALTDAFNAMPTEKTMTITIATIQSTYAEDNGAGFNQTHPTAHASGGSFVVPQQYGNEGFNMGGIHTASAGETVTITPQGQSGGSNNNMSPAILKQFADDIARSMRSVFEKVGRR